MPWYAPFCSVGLGDDGHIIGCAFLCVSHSLTGCKANVEDVVVGSGFRGQGMGRVLTGHIFDIVSR